MIIVLSRKSNNFKYEEMYKGDNHSLFLDKVDEISNELIDSGLFEVQKSNTSYHYYKGDELMVGMFLADSERKINVTNRM